MNELEHLRNKLSRSNKKELDMDVVRIVDIVLGRYKDILKDSESDKVLELKNNLWKTSTNQQETIDIIKKGLLFVIDRYLLEIAVWDLIEKNSLSEENEDVLLDFLDHPRIGFFSFNFKNELDYDELEIDQSFFKNGFDKDFLLKIISNILKSKRSLIQEIVFNEGINFDSHRVEPSEKLREKEIKYPENLSPDYFYNLVENELEEKEDLKKVFETSLAGKLRFLYRNEGSSVNNYGDSIINIESYDFSKYLKEMYKEYYFISKDPKRDFVGFEFDIDYSRTKQDI